MSLTELGSIVDEEERGCGKNTILFFGIRSSNSFLVIFPNSVKMMIENDVEEEVNKK